MRFAYVKFSYVYVVNESQNVEYKESFSEKAFQTLSAFANTEGGTLLVGVADDKTIKGVNYTNEEIERLTDQIVGKLGIYPSIRIEEESGKDILKIEVQKSSVPIHLSGKFYKRVGNTTRLMQPEELRDFLIKDKNWDSLTGDYKIDEIDDHTVQMFIKRAIKAGRLVPFDEEDSLVDILQSLNLIIDGELTNAAIVLFGKNPQKYFISAVVRVIKLKDDITIIGDKPVTGNLFNQAINVEEAIKHFIDVKYEIKGELQRTEIWDYPLEALREMLFNALIHRDYFKQGIQTQIKIYDDYLWSNNAGTLPQGITLE
ncbi:MAG: RNA-binding domain-containing protein [Cyanobacteriota bacterium]